MSDAKGENAMPEKTVKPIGDLHSVPHYRCGECFKAIVVYLNDEKPKACRWCGSMIDWEGNNDGRTIK